MWFLLGLIVGTLLGAFVVVPYIDRFADGFGADPEEDISTWVDEDEDDYAARLPK